MPPGQVPRDQAEKLRQQAQAEPATPAAALRSDL